MLRIIDAEIYRAGTNILKPMNLHLKAGRISVVLGANGVGKSTLLLALAGLHCDYKGSIELNNKDIKYLSHQHLARFIAWQGGLPPSHFGLLVEQRLQLAANISNSINNHTKITEAASTLELSQLLQRDMSNLSAGERQRVELAALLVRDASIWLLDEPMAHLDVRHQIKWLHILRQKADAGVCVIVVLHDVQQASVCADDVISIATNGQVTQATDASIAMCSQNISKLLDAPMQQMLNGLLLPDYS
ncbi:MAG: ABC transporter ATP-binding protein [Mariprofundales bacterium]